MTYTCICISTLANIGSDNGLSLDRRQAIIWTSGGILLIRTLETNFSEIHTFSFKKMHLEMSAIWQPFCLGLNVLTIEAHKTSPDIVSHVEKWHNINQNNLWVMRFGKKKCSHTLLFSKNIAIIWLPDRLPRSSDAVWYNNPGVNELNWREWNTTHEQC